MAGRANASRLNTRGTLEEPVDVRDADSGQLIPKWTFVRKVWLGVEYKSGKEGTRGDQIEPTATHTVWMRYRSDVSVKWRILLSGNRTLNILAAADPDNRRTWLLCQCIEVPS